MNNMKIVELLEELKVYVENDDIETISPITYREHEEWKTNKIGEIFEAISHMERQEAASDKEELYDGVPFHELSSYDKEKVNLGILTPDE